MRALAGALDPARTTALDTWLLAAWALASLACLTIALVVARRLARARRAWPEVALQGQRVRLARDFGPAVVGVRDAGIVVPGWLLACAAPVQRLVLALGGAIVIAMPWHPVAWWMLARLRLAVELDCDRRVLAGGVAPADYGALLLDVAGRGTAIPFGSPMLGIPTLATRTTHIERRLVAMTTPRARFARTRLVAAASLTVVALLAACESRLPTSAELEAMDVATMEDKLDLHADSIRFYVDEVPVSAEQARALDAKRIATVNISKDEKTKLKELRITTRDTLADAALPSKQVVSELVPTMTARNAAATGTAVFEGIVVIDGVRSSEAALKRLAPSTIATMDVFKGSHAQALFPNDPIAAKGVIRVWTKSAK